MNWRRNFLQRPAKPALGRGRVQRAARRELMLRDVVTTADVARRAFCRKQKFRPDEYGAARRALERLAERHGRDRGRGRPMLWRAKKPENEG
jgi:hypothetical protein